jgi:hypothetical protein
MLLDISPFRKYRDYRYLFISQLISVFGNMITYVALPFQIYTLTHSTIAVGVIGFIELADSMDRKKLLIISEFLIMLIILILAINASLAVPKPWIIYCSAGIIFG